MKLARATYSWAAMAVVFLVGGCTTLSPISHTQVGQGELQQQWTTYMSEHDANQKALTAQIATDKNDAADAIQKLHASFMGNLAQIFEDPQNVGTIMTAFTAVFGVAGAGFHLNNLRLDRKISHPEVPFSDDDDGQPDGGKVNDQNGNTGASGTSTRADASLEAATQSVSSATPSKNS